MNHSKVSTCSSFSSFFSSANLKRGGNSKDPTISIVDSIHPVKDTPQTNCTDNEVRNAVKLIQEECENVILAIKRHQKIALDVLRSKLLIPGDKEILRRMIGGLNETLLQERIKVTELRKTMKRYKRENQSLINDLRSHMAEVNYLTKLANGNAIRDPSVVRKMVKLEKQNRQLVAKCEILGKKESRKHKDTNYSSKVTKRTPTNHSSFLSPCFFETSKLTSSYSVLVDIRPSKNLGSGIQTLVSLVPEFHSLWLIDGEPLDVGFNRKLLQISDRKTKIDDKNKRLLSCLKNNRSSSDPRRKASTSVTVKFDPEVKCCLSDSIDSKIYCKKRADFIQQSAYNLLSNREIKVPLLMQTQFFAQYFVNLWAEGGGAGVGRL